MSGNVSEKITLNFSWMGPSSRVSEQKDLSVHTIDLVFKDANTNTSVVMPDDIQPSRIVKLPFTCPGPLKVTIEQIRDLKIYARIYMGRPNEGSSIRRMPAREITLKVPQELKIGKTYNLEVTSVDTSDDLSLSANLVEEGGFDRDEFQRRAGNMGEALIREGRQNLELLSRGGVVVFDSSSTRGDVLAHGLRGVIRAGQQMIPALEVPHTQPLEAPEDPLEAPEDLDKLSVDELQSLFNKTFIKDKQFEIARTKAAKAGDINELNRIVALEVQNSQLLMNLGEALEKKGVTPQMPDSEEFQSAANESAQSQAEQLHAVQEMCIQQ